MDYGSIQGTVRLTVAGPTQTVTDILERAHMVDNKAEATRRIKQGAVKLDGVRLDDPAATLDVPGRYELKVTNLGHHAIVILEEPA